MNKSCWILFVTPTKKPSPQNWFWGLIKTPPRVYFGETFFLELNPGRRGFSFIFFCLRNWPLSQKKITIRWWCEQIRRFFSSGLFMTEVKPCLISCWTVNLSLWNFSIHVLFSIFVFDYILLTARRRPELGSRAPAANFKNKLDRNIEIKSIQ